MHWYYVQAGQPVGPLSEADFQHLVEAGAIHGETSVWHDGMRDWRPYRELSVSPAPVAAAGSPAVAGLELRPMGIGDILDRTFRLYRSHFMPFFLVMLIVQSIAYVGTLAWQLSFWTQMPAAGQSAAPPGPAFFGAFALIIPVMIVTFVLNQVGIGALTAAVSSAFLHQEVSIRKALQTVRSKLGRLVGATLLNSLIIGLGFMLCIIPGIYFSLWYLLVSQVVIIESLRPVAALRRSKELMRVKTDRGFAHHNYTKAALILLIMFALGAVIGGIVSVPFAIAQAISGAHHAPSPYEPLQLLQGVLTMVVQAGVAPVGLIAMILFYYDIRIRKEGFDLELLAAALASQPN
jgi:hypothetical protein